jgi:CBS-domain-containing membrane protein
LGGTAQTEAAPRRNCRTVPRFGSALEVDMNVRDVMTGQVISVRPEVGLKEVARMLAEHGISGVPVVDEQQHVLGVVSEADFVIKETALPFERPSPVAWLFGESDETRARAAKLRATTAGQGMSSPAITINAERPIREAAAMMTRYRVNRLPVVEDDRLIGIVTRADLVGTFLVEDAELRRAVVDEVLRDTMWLDPASVGVDVDEGIVRLSGTVDRRSTATILERLVSQLDGVVGVESSLAWDLDDRELEPIGELHHEPTAASVTARELPR